MSALGKFTKFGGGAGKGGKKGAGGATTYGTPSQANYDAATAWHSGGVNEKMSGWERGSLLGGRALGNLEASAMEEGKTILGMAGSHAIRGAAWGAVGGGTIEAAQGGSFWDGAKQGAFNGAAGWTGYRMGMKAVGAGSMNPFARQTADKAGGLFSSANTMLRATSADAEVSKQAISILNNRQMEGVARQMMHQSKKKA